LAAIKAVSSLKDVPKTKPERCHQLTQDRDEHALDITGKWRLVFVIDHKPRGITLMQHDQSWWPGKETTAVFLIIIAMWLAYVVLDLSVCGIEHGCTTHGLTSTIKEWLSMD
jgi:hypothetical protein